MIFLFYWPATTAAGVVSSQSILPQLFIIRETMAKIYTLLKIVCLSNGRCVVMQLLWGCSEITVRYPCGFTGTTWLPSVNLGREHYKCPTTQPFSVCFIENTSTENLGFAARSHGGLRTMPEQGLCRASQDMSTGHGLTFLKVCATLSDKVVKAAETVNSCENLTAVACPLFS